MKIISKKEDSSLFYNSWLEYQKNNITGLNYSLDVIKYYLITNKEILISDESFVVMGEAHDKTCLAICFLPIYREKYSYSNAVAPIASKHKYLDACFKHIDKISKKHSLLTVEFSIDTCYSQYGEWRYNYLRDYGYVDCTANNSVFYLNNSPDMLFKKFNTSSRNIIRKTLKNNAIQLKSYDFKTISLEVFDQYKKYHTICSGRQTRSDESFLYMYQLIESSKAVLLELNYEGKPIGYLIVFLFYPYASLASISNLPEYEREFPIYRMLYWAAIKYCSDYKIMIYGYPAGSSLADGFKSYMDLKQLEIAKYKAHMGGVRVSDYKGIKYFDDDIAIQEVNYFKDSVLESITILD